MTLYTLYHAKKHAITKRLNQFKNVSPDDYFYELCFCLLTPQSNGKRCDEAVQALIEKDFKHASFPLLPIIQHKTRFHHTKAKHLLQMKHQYSSIHSVFLNEKDPATLRMWLVQHVKGIGMKEASHFLRNIGFTGLAILDRHILKNLQRYKCIPALPRSLTQKNYLEIEEKFIQFSKNVGISMDELDLLFWSMETGEVFK